MPTPKTKDVGKLRRFFRKEHPEWSDRQELAASLNTARHAGADIPEPRKKRDRPKRRKG